MDNLAHALTGALIARTLPAGWNGEPTADPGLDPDAETTRPGRWVMWASVVAANLPDFEALVLWPPPLGDKAAYLLHHRGWSHSLVGIAAEAAAFAGLLWLLARWRRTARVFAGFTPARGLAVAALGAGSHLFLDWWNGYGVRPFYPWDKTWYYGDLVFVVDPWVWLTLGGAVVCGTRRFGRARWLWCALTLAATAAVAEACRRAVVPWWVLIAWLTGVAEIAALRWWGRWRGARWVGWAMVGAYLLFAGWITAEAPRAVSDRADDWSGDALAVLPVPGVPWRREVIRQIETSYFMGWGGDIWERDYEAGPGPYREFLPTPHRGQRWGFVIHDRHPGMYPVPPSIENDPRVRAWRAFARVPTVEPDWADRADGSVVADHLILGDLRYRLNRGTDPARRLQDWSRQRVPLPPDDIRVWDPAAAGLPLQPLP